MAQISSTSSRKTTEMGKAIVKVFKDPSDGSRHLPDLPLVPASMVCRSVEQSILLTLQYLGKQKRAFGGGRLMTHEDSVETVIWPLFIERQRSARQVTIGGQSKLVEDRQETHYYFDAHQQLVRRTFRFVKGTKVFNGRLERVRIDTLEPDMAFRIKVVLRKFRMALDANPALLKAS